MKLKPAVFVLAAALSGVGGSHGQTLVAGDIAVLQFNPSTTDRIVVMPLVNLAANTSFTITDNGWLSSNGNGFTTTEGKLVFTVPSGGIRAGTLLKYENGSLPNTTTGFLSVSPSNFALNTSNDSLIIVRGTDTAVTSTTNISEVIYGIQSDASSPHAWDASGSTAPTSARPQLADTNLTPVMQGVNGVYSGVTTAVDRGSWITRLGATGNRTYSPTSQSLMAATSYAVTSNITWTGSTSTWSSATSVTNWDRSSNTTWFNHGDSVTFGSTGVGTILIEAAGITAGNLTFSSSGYTIQSNILTLAGAASTVNVITSGHVATVNSIVSGSGGLTKTGAGTLILGGANDYSGATLVSAGKLVVTDTIGSSAVIVSGSGAVLASDTVATIGSTLTIQSGAILAVGDAANASTATATVIGATTFSNDSIFSWDINNAGTSYDKLVTSSLVDGDAVGGAVFRIVAADATFASTFWKTSQTWTDIFTTSGSAGIDNWATIFGNAVSVVDNSFGSITPVGGSFSVSGSTLTWSAVPEPTSALAGLLITAGLLRRRRVA